MEKATESEIKSDFFFVIKKLGLSESEFEKIMQSPIKTIHDYHNSTFDPFYKKLEHKLTTLL